MASFVRCSFVLLGSVLSGLVVVHAQAPADAPPAGIVTGVITFGDTQRPARFAGVTLTPVPEDKPAVKPMSDKDMKDDPVAAMKLVKERMGSMTMLTGETGMDGTYAIPNVPPGDYYLLPAAPGYVSAFAAAQAAAPAGTTGKKVFAGVPMVHVEANHTVRGDVTLDRGAAVSGTVAFDDGTPVSKVFVMIEKAEKTPEDSQAAMTGNLAMMIGGGGGKLAVGDDRGSYRVAGLPSGEYVVKATLQVGSAFSMKNGVMDIGGAAKPSPLVIYAPGTLHKSAATKFKVKAGEERGDVSITVNLMGMHSVSGRISSAVDHHGLNEGSVELTDSNDKDFKRSGSVNQTGAFTVSYVPAGTYTLEVSDAADTEPAKKKAGVLNFASTHALKSYDDTSQSVVVDASDVTGVNIEMKESKTVKKEMDLNDLFKQ